MKKSTVTDQSRGRQHGDSFYVAFLRLLVCFDSNTHFWNYFQLPRSQRQRVCTGDINRFLAWSQDQQLKMEPHDPKNRWSKKHRPGTRGAEVPGELLRQMLYLTCDWPTQDACKALTHDTQAQSVTISLQCLTK